MRQEQGGTLMGESLQRKARIKRNAPVVVFVIPCGRESSLQQDIIFVGYIQVLNLETQSVVGMPSAVLAVPRQ